MSAPSNPPSAPSNPPSAPSNPPSAPSNPPSAPSNPPSAPSNPPSAPSNPPSAPSNPPSAPSNPPSAPSNPPNSPTPPPPPTTPPPNSGVSTPQSPGQIPTSTSQPQPPPPTSTPLPPPSSNPVPPPTGSLPTGKTSVLDDISTYSSTFFITTTDKHGSTILSAPSAFTSTFLTTNSLGDPITVTEIFSNPTLAPDGGHSSASSFFQNKGAVGGVFTIVGVAAAAIVLSVVFWFRKKRKAREIDHDTAVAATLAEHGYGRQHLIGPDDDHGSDPRAVTTPSNSGNSADMSAPSMTFGGFGTGPVSVGGYAQQSYNSSHPSDSHGQTYNPYGDNQVPSQNANQVPFQNANQIPSQNANQIPFQNANQMPSQNAGQIPSQYANQIPSQYADQGPSQYADQGPSQYADQGLPQYVDPGPGSHGGMITFFGRDEKRGMESSEPLLGATSDSDTSPEHPIVPPRNPLRLLGGSADGHGGYEDDDFEYEAHRNRLLKVRNHLN